MNSIVWIVLDSARYDAVTAARTPCIDQVGRMERRWSYASWTAPSHYAFLMGLLPHANAPHVLAADAYRADLARWAERLGGSASNNVSFANFVPYLSLPRFLKSPGYRTEAYVSLPVLNSLTPISEHFDHFELMPTPNDLDAIAAKLIYEHAPVFYFINTGETHYPYTLPGETVDDLPHLAGVYGVWRDLDDFLRNPAICVRENAMRLSFDEERLRQFWHKQVQCVEHVDTIIGRIIESAPPFTWFIVTSDHGELFGEGGYFGHGPIVHEKVFEVFIVEGLSPRAIIQLGKA